MGTGVRTRDPTGATASRCDEDGSVPAIHFDEVITATPEHGDSATTNSVRSLSSGGLTGVVA
jgi:hypothetical protein